MSDEKYRDSRFISTIGGRPEAWRGLSSEKPAAFVSVAALEIAVEEAEKRTALAQAQRDEVLQSTSWRMTAPIRKLAAAIPVSWRSHLRRAAKAVWWVATPWRMPQRLRVLRARSRGAQAEPPAAPSEGGYDRWIAEQEAWSSPVDGQRIDLKLSFLIIAGADVGAVARTLDSLRAQTLGRWEAVVGTSDSADPALLRKIKASWNDDARVTFVGSTAACRGRLLAVCAAKAGGHFVAVLDAGDILSLHAVSEIASELLRRPDSDIVYSDEDQLTAQGSRGDPAFKPGWSPDLLYAYNYFGRLTLIRRELVAQIGGFDVTLGAAAEWDLNLRASELAQTIIRVPKVLCHRHAGSDRDRPAATTEAAQDHRTVLRRFWARHGIDAKVETQADGTQRATWPLVEAPMVSIVVPTKDKVELLRMCIDGLLHRTDYPNKQIVIVDTGSTEDATLTYYEDLKRHAEIRIVHFDKKFNYSAACNYGAEFADGDLLLFLNNDIEVVSSDWLQEMVRFAMRPGVGVVGTKLVYPSRELQHGGVGIGIHLCGLMYRAAENRGWGLFGSPDHPRNWLAIMGACQMVSRIAFSRVGGFDESYVVAMSDVALCLQIWRAGYRIAYAPHACLVHHEGATRGKSNPTVDVQRIADDIRTLGVDEDPYLHPELDATAAIPTYRLGTTPSPRESLRVEVRLFGSPLVLTPLLDLADDGACLRSAELPRDEVLWLPQPAHAVTDLWSAARWCLDLLRTRPDIRRRFPSALSEGATGAFSIWLQHEGADRFGLPATARPILQALLAEDISVRARQAFLFHGELRDLLPHGLLPGGQYELFHWFMRHGRHEHGLRLEEIWWLFWKASEQPALELVRAYEFTPAWQALYPDGLTIFGRSAFAAWFIATHRAAGAWTEAAQWPVDLSPARQLRMAYHAREQWQRQWPEALEHMDQASGLIDWLQSPDARQTQDSRDWLAGLDKLAVAAELVAKGVNVIGHFAYPSGLRVSVEAMVEGLRRVGLRTALRDLRTDKRDDPVHDVYKDFEDYDTTIIHAQPEPFFDVAYSRSDLYERHPRTYRVGYWYWEFDSIPDSWVSHARNVNEVWAATEFVAKGLREKLSVPVRTLFPGVKLAPYERRPKSYFGLSEAPYTFLFTFHMMSVMERKNPLGLIRAFKLAFGEEEGVRLVLKTSFGDRHPAQIQELRDAAAGANITVIDQVYSPDEVLSLMDACDAYVSLHRSEGLGLTMAEAMLMGKPVIATNFSGNVDFMDESNSLLVRYELVKLGKPIPPYDAELEWAEPSVEHAAQLMRRVYEDQDWAREIGARGKVSAETNLSLPAAGRRIAGRLDEIKALRRRALPPGELSGIRHDA
ncbi:glycosyltransferase [Variovorax saccharolyticus]|uniref:glycosyltransferase n=1 Tax=Variovorax saccharolyticus TaxID=3053516 RepID=UPI00257729B8|nr:glycosyltransferase [Variovorax sp. J31P216]MDM0028702.1 glycosyltransferase [Variovorax sp. J31P216]